MHKFLAFFILAFSSIANAVEIESLPFRSWIVLDAASNEVIGQKNSSTPVSIASLTKLMTAYVYLKEQEDLSKVIRISSEDKDFLKNTSSRLPIGAEMTAMKAMELAIVSSENRAAHALARTSSHGTSKFISAMNGHAKLLGMTDTVFADPTGLSPLNKSSARDMARLVQEVSNFPLLKQFSNIEQTSLSLPNRELSYKNSLSLARSGQLTGLKVSKTGYTIEAGKCIAIKAKSKEGKELILVGLGAGSSFERIKGIQQVFQIKSVSQEPKPAKVNKKTKKKTDKKPKQTNLKKLPKSSK